MAGAYFHTGRVTADARSPWPPFVRLACVVQTQWSYQNLNGSSTASHPRRVAVQCVRGIEINSYAAELARVTVWIGEIHWMLRHGVPPSKNPILKPLETIECRDAILNENGSESEWPRANVIIGNPPFLENKRMLAELGESYTKALRQQFIGRLPGGVDLVTYWFEKARTHIRNGHCESAGLVATHRDQW